MNGRFRGVPVSAHSEDIQPACMERNASLKSQLISTAQDTSRIPREELFLDNPLLWLEAFASAFIFQHASIITMPVNRDGG